jgi:parallel beta-helix repeat protein
MKFTHLLSLVSFAFVGLSTGAQAAAGVGTAIPAGTVSSAYVITKPGAYYLAGERIMTDNTIPIIAIQSDDVTLDLAGYSISFATTSGGSAPAILSQKTNLEVRNGSILNVPYTGIDFGGVSQFRIIDVRVSDVATGAGINVGSYGIVRNCDVFHCATGISAAYAAVVENCRITGTTYRGIDVSAHCTVRSNVVSTTTSSGISVSAYCVIEDNTISSANSGKYINSAGIWVAGMGNTVRNNSVTNCPVLSIAVSGKTVVEGNTIYSSDVAHTALKNFSGTVSLSRGNNITAKTSTSGSWVDGGGNVIF